MNRFLIVGFEYNNVIDYCLVRYKPGTDHNEYLVTVMNGQLEKVLYGNHIIREKQGFLEIDNAENNEQCQLKLQITTALGELLDLPVKELN